MIKKMILVALLVILTACLVGCQTVSGFGGDIKWTADQTASMMDGM